jgi:hypothetical protein
MNIHLHPRRTVWQGWPCWSLDLLRSLGNTREREESEERGEVTAAMPPAKERKLNDSSLASWEKGVNWVEQEFS